RLGGQHPGADHPGDLGPDLLVRRSGAGRVDLDDHQDSISVVDRITSHFAVAMAPPLTDTPTKPPPARPCLPQVAPPNGWAAAPSCPRREYTPRVPPRPVSTCRERDRIASPAATRSAASAGWGRPTPLACTRLATTAMTTATPASNHTVGSHTPV